ncbi:MAG TPA: ChbG/HpnK family deacetylase [Rhizomicrobium sp.]
MAKHRVVLCADDYGLSPGVSRGIRELLELERLSATSCMTIYPEFEADGPLLQPHFGKADIGLHFTVTANQPVRSVMRDAYLGRLDVASIAAELELQLASFVSVMGRQPDYIDGHQHVHLLPGIREAVTLAAHRIGAYVRSIREPVGLAMSLRPSPVEAAFLSWSARPLQALALNHGLSTNRGFRGVRTFRETTPYRELFRRMIRGAGEGCLIMCHPGFADARLANRDCVTKPREDELGYLVGEAFPRDLAYAGLVLSRLLDRRVC